MVLFRIWTALKEDHSATLQLPGEFFGSTGLTDTPDPASYVAKLKTSMQQLQVSAVRTQPQRKTYISKDPATSTHVFVCHDAVSKPLPPPYDGPYYVLNSTNKHYTLEITNRREVVSLDCLKPTLWSAILIVTLKNLHRQLPQPDLALSQEQLHILVDKYVDPYTIASRSLQSLGGSVVVVWQWSTLSQLEVIISGTVHNHCYQRILYRRSEIVELTHSKHLVICYIPG